MEDYNAELMKGWIEDTVNEKVSLEKESLLSIGEARGKTIGFDTGKAVGIDEGRLERDEEIKSAIMSSDITPEMRNLIFDFLEKSKK